MTLEIREMELNNTGFSSILSNKSAHVVNEVKVGRQGQTLSQIALAGRTEGHCTTRGVRSRRVGPESRFFKPIEPSPRGLVRVM